MQLDKIISMANQKVRLPFLAMERSLRATGCKLPLWVIPYDDNLFDLPTGSHWWRIPEIADWLGREKAHPVMGKYQCLTTENYQFVDSDICFLRDPEEVLAPFSGFVTSCGHWRDTAGTCTLESQTWLAKRSTLWHRDVFNTGQFACDRILYTPQSLIDRAMQPDFISTCVRWVHNEQPGLDLLVLASEIEVNNLTLPPLRMESTWAGDYPGEYTHYWQNPQRKPYLIHWAGMEMDTPRPINKIFYQFLTPEEKMEWEEHLKENSRFRWRKNRFIGAIKRRFKQML